MDKQQFDHIENRIRQAADDINVPFNEDAWKKMEIKLDNEFSKGHRRRGLVWWWFSFLLVGVATFGVYIYKSGPGASTQVISDVATSSHTSSSTTGKIHAPIASRNNKADQKTAPLQETSIEPIRKHDSDSEGTPAVGSAAARPDNNKVQGGSMRANAITRMPSAGSLHSKGLQQEKNDTRSLVTPGNPKSVTPKHGHPPVNSLQSGDAVLTSSIGEKQDKKQIKTKQALDPANGLLQDKSEVGSTSNTGLLSTKTPLNTTSSNSLSLPVSPIIQGGFGNSLSTDTSQKNSLSKNDVARKDSGFNVNKAVKKTPVKLEAPVSKGFYILASVAGDATGIKNISIKDSKPVFGAGIGYRFNNRLSVQTGFYFGQKVYSAGPEDYKVKPGSYVAKIISAEAECYIYDIPLTVRYDVFHTKRSNLFATSGLSSYLLKRETYDIHFYNPTGTYRHMSYTYTHNVNYLSVFNLSFGYERKISNSVFIQAEPYLKIPLGGLGEGSVKLYSAGLQLGIKYQPFQKKK